MPFRDSINDRTVPLPYTSTSLSAMPINNLPSEILQAVFELVVGKANRQLDGPTTQEVLCSVCHVWRDLALQDPLLWNTIYFPTTEGAMQRTKLFVQRSATAPLELYITSPKNMGPLVAHIYGSDFLELINAESHRWRFLEVDIPELVMDLKPIWDGHPPMLEELVVDGRVSLQRIHPQSQWPLLSYGVRILTVVRFALRWDQWSCLSVTHLSLGPFSTSAYAPTAGELSGILAALSDTLCSFTMKGTWGSRNGSAFHGPIILKALKSLTTSIGWDTRVKEVLVGCRFPALEHIDMHISLFDALPPALISVLSDEPKLFLSVKRLSIGLVGDANSSTGQVLQRGFPQLDHLRLSPYTPLDPSLSTFLSRSWGSMTRLDLSEAGLSEVKDLLAKRLQNHPTPLRELRLSVARGVLYREDYEWIKLHVGRLFISQVRPDVHGFAINKEVWAFHERHLVAQAPVPRAPPKQMQIRAL